MYCVYCGKEIADETVNCDGCGRQIRASIPDNRSWSSLEMLFFIIGTILIPLGGIVFGIINYHNPQRKNQALVLVVISGVIFALMVICYYLFPFIFIFLNAHFRR
jgi:hypothetical protein